MASCFCGCGQKVSVFDRAIINSRGRRIVHGVIRIDLTEERDIRVSRKFRFDSLDEFCDEGEYLAVRMKALVHQEIEPLRQDRQASRAWFRGWKALEFHEPPRPDADRLVEALAAFQAATLSEDGTGWL